MAFSLCILSRHVQMFNECLLSSKEYSTNTHAVWLVALVVDEV